MFDLSLESGMDTLYYAGYRTVCGAGGKMHIGFDYAWICTALYVVTLVFRCHPAASCTLKCAASAQSWRK